MEVWRPSSPQATFQVMRKYLDTASVVWEKILLRPPSLGGRLTDRKSEEQQAAEVVSSTIDRQLTSKVHYTDRPEPQHDDLHFTNVLITTYESLSGTTLWPSAPSCSILLSLYGPSLWVKHKNHFHCQSDGSLSKEEKATLKHMHFVFMH